MRDVQELQAIARKTFATYGLSDPEKVVVARSLLELTHWGRATTPDKKNGEKSADDKFRGELRVCAHTVKFEWSLGGQELTPELRHDLVETAQIQATGGIRCNFMNGDLFAIRPRRPEFEGWWRIT